MTNKKIFTLKQDTIDNLFSTPQTPVKKVVYKDMMDSSALDCNISSEDFTLSDDFSQCTLSNKIGEGDFYNVYKIKKGNYTALKRSKNPIKNHLDFKFYNKEVSILKLIESEYVTKYINSFTYQSHFFIEMEFCNGGDLRSFMTEIFYDNKNTIKDCLINKIMMNVATGLRDIHKQGFVHLDVKPENIYLVVPPFIIENKTNKNLIEEHIEEVNFKIGDLGIATKIGEDIKLDGDKRYMGPEVLKNICTPASDIYSLGLIYLELLRGINLPKKGDMWHKLRRNKFTGLKMDLIGRRMLYSNYKKRCNIEEVIKHFSGV